MNVTHTVIQTDRMRVRQRETERLIEKETETVCVGVGAFL